MTDFGTRQLQGCAARRLPPAGLPDSALRLVTDPEWKALEQAVARGQVPSDLAVKLARLNRDDLRHRQLEQNCRLFLALLEAAGAGQFGGLTCAQRHRLLLALAYVQKDEDAIPDYRRDGFTDDQREVRGIAEELESVLRAYKLWRLRHLVPHLWRTSAAAARRVAG
ncbi:MAG: hypothetical protein JXQ71_06025 [Verrucomicrobia bacterium]|nr:hypothetical protein [Verrucomicrobiota bacterium]